MSRYDSDMPDDPHYQCHDWIRERDERIAAIRNEVASVLMLMDELATVWGDEGVFRRCRDRLRALVPKCDSCGGHGTCSGEATGLVCGACNGTGIESDEEID